MLFIGPHVSTESHLALSVDRAKSYGATGFAIFTKNQRQWKSPKLKEEEIEYFKTRMKEEGFDKKSILPHSGYLINPASPESEIKEKSLSLLKDELDRCLLLGLDILNIHPGAYKEGDRIDGIKRSAKMLDDALEEREGVRIAVENTAGAGTIIGNTFDELEAILENAKHKDQIGFTLDTAHLYGAGYDVKDDIDGILDDFFRRLGKDKLYGMHLNDSKVPLSSKKDRHDSIGAGLIGLDPFLQIVRRNDIENIPLILETPDENRWAYEIRTLQDEYRRTH